MIEIRIDTIRDDYCLITMDEGVSFSVRDQLTSKKEMIKQIKTLIKACIELMPRDREEVTETLYKALEEL